MLSQMRQNTKTILWIVIVAFVGLIVVAWGMNYSRTGGAEAGIIAKINGERVTVDEYRNEVANQRAVYYQEKGRNYGSQVENELNQKAWDTVVQNRLLMREVMRQKLSVTDDEVLLELEANPPAFVRSQPVFQTDSAFDHDKYIRAIQEQPEAFVGLEAYIRQTLPRQKLIDFLASGVRVTDDEAQLLLAMLDEKASISYVRVSPKTDVKDITAVPTDSDISNYYSGHQDEFKVPEKRKLRSVQFEKAASAEDERFAMDRLQEALDLINEGENFEEIAAEYSDDETTGPRGGDLGWRKHGQLPSAMDSVASSLEAGQVSSIFRIQNSLHVLKVDEKRVTDGVEEVKVRQILARVEPSPSTVEDISNRAAEFRALARKKGLDEAASEMGFTPSDSPELSPDQIGSFFRIGKEDAASVAKAQRNDVVGPVDGSLAFYVVETSDIVAEHVPPLDQITDRVRQAYLYSLRKDRAREIATAVAQAVSQGRPLADAAAAWNLKVTTTDLFTRTSGVPGVGKDNMVVATAFVLGEGQTSKPVEAAGDFFVVRLEKKQAPDLAAIGQNMNQIKYSLLTTKQQAFVNDWYSNLLSKAAIDDYRSREAGAAPRPVGGYFYGGY